MPKMDLSLQVFAEFKGSLSRPHIVADRIDNLFYLYITTMRLVFLVSRPLIMFPFVPV